MYWGLCPRPTNPTVHIRLENGRKPEFNGTDIDLMNTAGEVLGFKVKYEIPEFDAALGTMAMLPHVNDVCRFSNYSGRRI